MFDINPETHRHHLAEIERQIRSLARSNPVEVGKPALSERVRNAPAALAAVFFMLGGLAGGTLF
ncbi:hypothetical protein HKCCSP123_09220 [Rhodobacterales bacterium HKCCSP123]|nr:hypothetical protein [Rhodobacterales bacterium HKCCSP123]